MSTQLATIQALGPNWDGYGAPKVSRSIVDAARRLAVAIYPYLSQAPRVMPTADGHIQFEWHGDQGRILEIEIENDNRIHYLKWNPVENIDEEDLAFIAAESTIIKGLAEWFLGMEAADGG